MGLGLLFLALLATLGSGEYPGGNNGGFGTRGISKNAEILALGKGERAARRIWGLTRRLRGAFGLTPPTRSSLRAVGLAGRVLLSPPNPAAPLSPAAQDTYWAGTAPICLGGCKGKHKELKRSQCGAGSCCWLGYKSFCRGRVAQFGAMHFGAMHFGAKILGPGSHLWGFSSSPVNCGRPEADFNSLVHGNDWWVGSVVRYSCRPGYLLLGDPASACQPDGRWTPKPTCLREYPMGWQRSRAHPKPVTGLEKGLGSTQGTCCGAACSQGSACEAGSSSASGRCPGGAPRPAAP